MLNPSLPAPADEAALRRLLAHYSQRADRLPAAPGWAECFTEDAVVRIFAPGHEAPLLLGGLDAIERAFQRVAPQCRQVHLVSNTVIAVDGATAHIESYFARLDIDDDFILVGSFGRYRDVARRCREVDWRLSARDIHIVSRSSARSRAASIGRGED